MFDVIGPINYSTSQIFLSKKGWEITFTFHRERSKKKKKCFKKGEGGNYSTVGRPLLINIMATVIHDHLCGNTHINCIKLTVEPGNECCYKNLF